MLGNCKTVTVTNENDEVVAVIADDELIMREGYKAHFDVKDFQETQDKDVKVFDSDVIRDAQIGRALRDAFDIASKDGEQTVVLTRAIEKYRGWVVSEGGASLSNVRDVIYWAEKESEAE